MKKSVFLTVIAVVLLLGMLMLTACDNATVVQKPGEGSTEGSDSSTQATQEMEDVGVTTPDQPIDGDENVADVSGEAQEPTEPGETLAPGQEAEASTSPNSGATEPDKPTESTPAPEKTTSPAIRLPDVPFKNIVDNK